MAKSTPSLNSPLVIFRKGYKKHNFRNEFNMFIILCHVFYATLGQTLYEMFMDHRMKTFQGAFHLNYDYSTWYGYAKMKKDLVEIKEMAKKMRREKNKKGK